MGSGLLNVSVTGLNAAQMGIQTTSHNISNASTPGFNRQTIVQTTNTPMFSGAGFIGQGTNIETVKRVYNDFLNTQVKTAETNAAQLDMYATQISQIDNLLADPSAGLSPALQSFFTAISAAAANPSSVPSRQAMLSAGQALASRFQGLDQQLTDMRSGVNTQIKTEVTTINSYVKQISDINQRIAIAQAAGSSQPANDLYDQRDQLISDLNKEIKVTVNQESDGSYSVFFGSGQPLVVGTQTYEMKTVPDQEDLTNVRIALGSPNGDQMTIPESLIIGGKLAGLLGFRDTTLTSAQNGIGRIALALATNMNAQHALGQDLNGDLGGNFFKPITLSTLGAPSNKGNAAISASIMVSDYKVVYGQSGYTVTRLADDKTLGTFNSLPQVVDGVRISLTAGAPASGDTFLVSPNAATADRVVALTSNTGTATLASTGSNVQTLTDSDYRLTMSATNTLTLVRLSDQQTWMGSGATQAAAIADLMTKAAPQGFDLAASGTMQVGDSFLIRPTRNGARDISLAVTDARNIALAAPMRTAAALTNTGTATISAGAVSDTSVQQQAPFTVSYEAATQSLTGFPVGSTVVVGGTTYKISDSTTRVAYSSPANISVNGTGAVITGTPADGDTFTIGADTIPAYPPPAIGNTGFATLFGLPTNTVGANAVVGPPALPATAGFATGGVSLPNPLVITAGKNDQFTLALDGNAAVTVTLPAGSYTPNNAWLTAVVQPAIDTALGVAPPAAGSVTASLDVSNHLVLTSNTTGPTSAVSLGNVGNSGTGSIVAMAKGSIATTVSLPSSPITLVYHQATVSPVQPARLSGFPVGSIVTITPRGGQPTNYPISLTTTSVPYISEATIAFNGISFSISGPAAEGDKFTIAPNTSGVADNRNASLLGALQTKTTMGDASSTYQSAYSQVVSQIGNKAREINVTLQAQEKLVTQGNDAIQSQSGVNLDEEAANLLRYQQAYQAAAKIINISGKLFDTLLSLGQ
jgi:flagellar hook-associated protein 1 FlgK